MLYLELIKRLVRQAKVRITLALSFMILAILFMYWPHQAKWAEQKMRSKVLIHSFGFDTSETPVDTKVEILNFQYGDSNAVGTFVEDDWLAAGRVGQGGGVTGGMPVGDFLYVKWRILTSGEVKEDRVDLKERLPSDMYQKIIHFTFRGPQLTVYIIEGNTKAQLHAPAAADCPVWSYGDFRCTRIYPDRWANF